MRDVGIIVLSVIVAVLLAKTGALERMLVATEGMQIVGAFIAGLFFTSVFTVAPATVALGEIAQANSLFLVALIGGLGALCGDMLIFRFIRDSVSRDIARLIHKSRFDRFVSIFRFKFFKWLTPFIGALIVASPLPDELGLALMGFSKMKTSLFIPLVFALDFVGILVVGLIARAAM